jgi:hypothetical protein
MNSEANDAAAAAGDSGVGNMGDSSAGLGSDTNSNSGDADGSYGRAEANRMSESAANRAAESAAMSGAPEKPSAWSLQRVLDTALTVGGIALNAKSGGLMGTLGVARGGLSLANSVQGLGFGRHSGTNQIGSYGDDGFSSDSGGGSDSRASVIFGGRTLAGPTNSPQNPAFGGYTNPGGSADSEPQVTGDAYNSEAGGTNYVQSGPRIMPILLAIGAALLLGA